MKRIFSFLVILCFAFNLQAAHVEVGAEQTKQYLPLLMGKRVALLSNHTGIVIQGNDTIHTLDLLLQHGVEVTAIFSPEHGFRGTAREGEHVASSVDPKTGIPILSLYDGKSYRPSKEAMATFDILITDIVHAHHHVDPHDGIQEFTSLCSSLYPYEFRRITEVQVDVLLEDLRLDLSVFFKNEGVVTAAYHQDLPDTELDK